MDVDWIIKNPIHSDNNVNSGPTQASQVASKNMCES